MRSWCQSNTRQHRIGHARSVDCCAINLSPIVAQVSNTPAMQRDWLIAQIGQMCTTVALDEWTLASSTRQQTRSTFYHLANTKLYSRQSCVPSLHINTLCTEQEPCIAICSKLTNLRLDGPEPCLGITKKLVHSVSMSLIGWQRTPYLFHHLPSTCCSKLSARYVQPSWSHL